MWRVPRSPSDSWSLKFYLYNSTIASSFLLYLELFILFQYNYLHSIVTVVLYFTIFILTQAIIFISCYCNPLYFARIVVFLSTVAFIQVVLNDSPFFSFPHPLHPRTYIVTIYYKVFFHMIKCNGLKIVLLALCPMGVNLYHIWGDYIDLTGCWLLK